MRWALPGRRKRGGIRVIYIVFWRDAQIGLLLKYSQDNLSSSQLKQIREVVERWQ
jgi:hypothetical protein